MPSFLSSAGIIYYESCVLISWVEINKFTPLSQLDPPVLLMLWPSLFLAKVIPGQQLMLATPPSSRDRKFYNSALGTGKKSI
ncbi:hypothetical protein PNOK_0612800 [Pyrrhoderma noxium]|uniref:Uncharacterized protein n=1 Tax=Pyrrhoderma noxium TaxID=2282107 RepID=A0A286UDF1_9AGAM|nr:hypothetical protein PNOK_0612800 [Pyrrhoderma noxium]